MWESAKWYHWNARTQNTPDGIEIGIGGIFTDATNIAQALQLSDYHTRDPTTLNKLFWMINTNALDSHVLRKKKFFATEWCNNSFATQMACLSWNTDFSYINNSKVFVATKDIVSA